jgi:hypothetical protein
MAGEYSQLLSLAQKLEHFARHPPSGAQKQRVKEMQRRYDKECRRMVDAALSEDVTHAMARGYINRDITNLIHHNPTHEATLINMRSALLSTLDNDEGNGQGASKGSMVPYLLLMIGLTGLFLAAMHFFGPGPVVSPADSAAGMTERARAFDRVAMYNRWHSKDDRWIGIVVNTALSPFAPSEEELRGAAAFEQAVMAQYGGLRRGRDICGTPVSGADKVALVKAAASYITGSSVDWQTPVARTLRTPIMAFQPCPER